MPSEKMHREEKRWKTYEPGDCILYHISCSCGKDCGGWTPTQAEETFKKHLEDPEGKNEPKEDRCPKCNHLMKFHHGKVCSVRSCKCKGENNAK